MRRFVLIPVVMAAVVLRTAVPVLTAAAQTLTTTSTTTDITGTLVDVACYAALGPKATTGADHTKCAIACAQKGGRLALVTSTGAVYMVTGVFTQNNNAKLSSLMNLPVVLTGTVGVRYAPVAAPIVVSDGRRPTGTEDGVVGKARFRQGDVRQGDVPTGSETTLEVTNAKLATK